MQSHRILHCAHLSIRRFDRGRFSRYNAGDGEGNDRMNNMISKMLILTALFCLTVCSWAAAAENHPAFSDDGAWCWFQDPRTVYVEGEHKRTYVQWMTHDGRLQVGFYDHDTGERKSYILKEGWGVDDHNVGSFLVLPDKRLMVFYATHGGKGLYCRTAKAPESITDWEDEVTVVGGPGVTYSHPVYLSSEKMFYVFWRGSTRKPTYSKFADGKTWSEPRVLIEQDDGQKGARPYLKVFSDGKSAIHFAFTDGHPDAELTNSIYYLRYKKGAFYKADGTRVGGSDDLPIQHTESDLVYDAKPSKARAWVWDIALDRAGRPIILYTRMPDGTDHRLHHARWTGTKWQDTELCAGGGWFPQTPEGKKETEPWYAGGMCFKHSDPSVVYLSRKVNGVFEIERWSTLNGGKSWTSVPITSGSKELNVRPVVPRGYAGKQDHVLWMHGPYTHFTNYRTAIRMLGASEAGP